MWFHYNSYLYTATKWFHYKSYPVTTTRWFCYRLSVPDGEVILVQSFRWHDRLLCDTKATITTWTTGNKTATRRDADVTTFGKTCSISPQSTALQPVWITSKFECSSSTALPNFYQFYQIAGVLKKSSLLYPGRTVMKSFVANTRTRTGLHIHSVIRNRREYSIIKRKLCMTISLIWLRFWILRTRVSNIWYRWILKF